MLKSRNGCATRRWSSPDPSGTAAFHLTDPQTINRYVYARNTPLSVVDPTGLEDVIWDDAGFDGGSGGDGAGDPTSGGSQDNSGADVNPNDSGATPLSDGSQVGSNNNANQQQQTDFGQVQCTNANCTTATQTVTVTETDPALRPEATAILSKTNSLAEGPMNVMSVVFVVEAGVIAGVEAGPAAGEALDTITPTVENSVGWSKVYQFVSGMVNQNRPPLTVPALVGNVVGPPGHCPPPQ